jgi:hypothetical protein
VTRRDALPRWFVPAWVTACCLGTLLAKLLVNADRTQVNHGDISFYYAVAQNLAEGRGFVIDYIWNFWNHPTGVPTPSNVWWMPLTSVIAAVGMWFGRPDYVSAQRAMIVATSVLPLVMYLVGRDAFRSRAVGLVGALFATTFHLFLDQPSAPLSHGPYVVLAPLTLWLIVRSTDDPRWLKWAGASIALTQLARSDGIVLFAALLAAHLVHWRRPPWRALLAVPLAYALVMAPWWAHNLSVHGALMPGGSFRAVFLSDYEAWYSLPESVTPQTWLADGWEPVLEAKWRRPPPPASWPARRTARAPGSTARSWRCSGCPGWGCCSRCGAGTSRSGPRGCSSGCSTRWSSRPSGGSPSARACTACTRCSCCARRPACC